MIKQKIFEILSIIATANLGLLFIYSGYTKINPIEPFEYTFVDLGIVNWALAPFVARFMIGLEFFIGLMLFFNLYLKKFTLKLTVITLVIFTIYLLVMIVREGNNGNCGCFGNAIAMTPLQAVIKNVIMLVICFIIYKFYNGYKFENLTYWISILFLSTSLIIADILLYKAIGITLLNLLIKNVILVFVYFSIYKFHEGFVATSASIKKLTFWLSVLFLLTSLIMPHVLNYVDLNYSEAYLTKPEDKFTLELDTLYNNATKNIPPKTLSQGKHVLAFMSLSCLHCRVAAKKIRIMHEKNPDISFYFILNGEDIKLKQFYADTKTENIPYCMLKARPFIYLAGLNLPTIYLINDSKVEHWVNYMQLDQAEVEKWIKE